MTSCPAYTAAIARVNSLTIAPLRCWSWHCPRCQPLRRRWLIRAAQLGRPNRLLTLTVNRTAFPDPDQACAMLRRTFHRLMTYLRRTFPAANIQYLAVLEATKAGHPHLHILLRSAYLPQPLLSALMNRFLLSPIVDIRAIHNTREAARYVAKYVGKAPHRFKTAYRYSRSRQFLPPGTSLRRPPPKQPPIAVAIFPHDLHSVLYAYLQLPVYIHRIGHAYCLHPANGPPDPSWVTLPPPPLTPIAIKRPA